ncbi:hypothetical protein DPMN_033924 [Dreissena polymorpha]|uniref:Uncharacterized protein n=1 Tax=Dreissena polymorpha TaxID=45954 RepID=A0A9D4M7Y5_DREPO|nr:hypothetical protein DPMN_033924 [Dreissena polymorpha]
MVICYQSDAAFGSSIKRNKAIRTGKSKHILHDRLSRDNGAMGWLENQGKFDSHSRNKRAVVGDSGYGSRLDAGKKIANDNLQRKLFADLGKRAAAIDSGYRSRHYTAQIVALVNLQRVLFADLGKRAAVGDSGYGSRLDAGQNIAAGNLQRFLFADLGKRSMIGDSGYGSRLDAGQHIANDYLQRSLFASLGKRALDFTNTNMPSEQRFMSEFADFGKRAVTGDSGYGSRLDADQSIANDYLQRSLFASLGKRDADFTDTYMPSEQRFMSEFADHGKRAAVGDNGYGSRLDAGQNMALGNLQRVLFADLGKRAVTCDSGYGSRLDAGKNIANDYLQRSLFASLGKRGVDYTDAYMPSEQSVYGFGLSLTEDIVKRVLGDDKIFERNIQKPGTGIGTASGYFATMCYIF